MNPRQKIEPMMDKVRTNLITAAILGVGSLLAYFISDATTKFGSSLDRHEAMIVGINETQVAMQRTLDRVVLIQGIQDERCEENKMGIKRLEPLLYAPENR